MGGLPELHLRPAGTHLIGRDSVGDEQQEDGWRQVDDGDAGGTRRPVGERRQSAAGVVGAAGSEGFLCEICGALTHLGPGKGEETWGQVRCDLPAQAGGRESFWAQRDAG